jgi:HEPN domain
VLIKEYIPQKEQEFLKCYEDDRTSLGVIDMLQLRDAWWVGIYHPVTRRFIDNFEIQRSILLSVPDVADVKELNLRKLISADVARTEIEEAEVLFSGKHHRAAGSVAGVALELHLKTQCDIKGVSYKPTDTLDPLATALYTAGELDKTELKHIQYLASIRNKCSHPDPVTEGEVKALIEGVKKII